MSAEKDNENAVNLLIADAFRIPGAMDRLDRREGSEQPEPVFSRGGVRWMNCRSEDSC